MKTFFTFFCLAVFVQSANAQIQFKKQFYNVTRIQGLLQTSDDGLLALGYIFNLTSGNDAYVASYDHDYNIKWSTKIGTNDFETAYDAIETKDKNFLVAACKQYNEFDPTGTGRAFVLYKLDNAGNLLWSRQYDFYNLYDPESARIIQLNDSSLIITGMTFSRAYNINQTVMMKVNIQDGTPVWAKDFYASFASILKNDDKSFLFVAESKDQHPERNSDIFKIDDNGNTIWHKQIDNMDGEYRVVDMVKADSGFLMAGYVSNTVTTKTEVLILKISDTGASEWAKSYGTKFNDYSRKIIKTKDSNYAVLDAIPYKKYMYLMKLNKSGNLIWNTATKDTADLEIRSIFELKDSSFVMSAGNWSPPKEYLFKTDYKGVFCKNENLSLQKRDIIVTIRDVTSFPVTLNVDTKYNSDSVTAVYTSLITACETSVLPLKLLSFSVTRSGKTNLLKWTAAQEINTDNFEIQRSNNSRDFASIGNVRTLNNGKTKNDYAFTDAQPLKAVNYYRLKLLDKDGKFTYSAIKNVNNSGSFDVAVYPNPVHQNLTLNFNTEEAIDVQVEIVNAHGKKVYSNKLQLAYGASLQNINVAPFAAGNYFIKCITVDGQVGLKFVKQ